MKYSEFEKDIKAMGYSIIISKNYLYVREGEYSFLISVGLSSTHIIDSAYELFRRLEDSEKERLLSLAWQLASTPLKDREDEKRYRLRLPFIKSHEYLNLDKFDGVYELSSDKQVNNYKTIFTESEIAELKAKHNLDSFVLEEVKEDE